MSSRAIKSRAECKNDGGCGTKEVIAGNVPLDARKLGWVKSLSVQLSGDHGSHAMRSNLLLVKRNIMVADRRISHHDVNLTRMAE